MKLSSTLRRSTISVIAVGYYIAVVHLLDLSIRPTSMAQFFGHALIYAAAVGLVSIVFFLADNSATKKREEHLETTAVSQN